MYYFQLHLPIVLFFPGISFTFVLPGINLKKYVSTISKIRLRYHWEYHRFPRYRLQNGTVIDTSHEQEMGNIS